MKSWGCKITTIAMLMVGAGVESTSNFDPGVLRNRYTSKGYIIYGGAQDGCLSAAAVSQANSPNFYKAGSKDFTYSFFNTIYNTISSLLNSGYHIEVRVDYNGHSVAVTGASGGKVYIHDPAYNITTLNQWDGTIIRADYYIANPSKSDTLTASGYNYPTSLTIGERFYIKGTVTSGYSNISSLTAGVYNTSGTLVTGKTVYPNAKSYNLANVDPYIYFNNLAAGTYDYKVTGTNASGTTTVINKRFTVASSLTVSGYNYPTTLTVGDRFYIKGTVTSSNSNITSLTAGVYNTAGQLVTGKTVSPNAYSYNLVNVDPYVYFNNLTPGTYDYKVIATNASGTTTLINKRFNVVSSLSLSNYNYPTQIAYGRPYSIYGTVKSTNSNITKLTVGVYNNSGTLLTGKTVYPNATSYDIAKVDYDVYFNHLARGTYYYKIIATNTSGTVTLLNKAFTVY